MKKYHTCSRSEEKSLLRPDAAGLPIRPALLYFPFMGEAGWLSPPPPLSPLTVDPWNGELVACSSGERPVVSTRLRWVGFTFLISVKSS